VEYSATEKVSDLKALMKSSTLVNSAQINHLILKGDLENETISKETLEHDGMFFVSISRIKQSLEKQGGDRDQQGVIKSISLVLSEL
jgi:hypothetical protein